MECRRAVPVLTLTLHAEVRYGPGQPTRGQGTAPAPQGGARHEREPHHHSATNAAHIHRINAPIKEIALITI